MIEYIPPLQTLRAFEAAARHLSYSRAAEELSLTHGAISHHVARLERDLGNRLFVRDGQRMILTDAGQILVLDIRQGLKQLAKAFVAARSRARHKDAQRTLNVSVLPSFAARWLVPRIAGFQADCPDVEIAIRPTATLTTLDGRDGIDLAIRYGPGEWPGLQSIKLMASTIYPVCSPNFANLHRLAAPRDLLSVTVIRSPRQKWRPWLIAAGLDAPEPEEGPIYDDAALVLQAAAMGQGVALARATLAAEDIAAHRLIRLFDVEIEDDYAWHLVWREPVVRDAQAHSAFRRWIEAEASRDP
ncbi:transcriptional regulator GcvA [Salinisphaera aquimarina]|uniref:Transcriptional regulator GcvA n=1 Tax=Salinisphaera aquimarina TaxID=2094031 RepID=A0ABV7ELF2_9GAMM